MMSVRLSLKILVTTVPIGFYSSGNIPTGPVMVLGYFLNRVGQPTPPPKKKKIYHNFFYLFIPKICAVASGRGYLYF